MDIISKDRRILDIGLSFLTMFCSVFIGSALFMFLDIGIGAWQFPFFSLIGMLIFSYFRFAEDGSINVKIGVLYYLIYLLIVSILGIIAQSIWDPSVDGRWYHSEAILRLTDGWNPIYYKLENVGKWSYYYCKATWYQAADIAMFLGNHERGKLYNMFFELTTVIISVPFFRRFFNTRGYAVPVIGAFVMFLNPVAWAQRFTFYQDSALGLLLIMVFMICFFIWKDEENVCRKSNFMALFCAAAFVSNIKFTGLAYCSVFLFIFMILTFITRGRKNGFKLFGFLLISFIIISMVLGFSPYVKNMIEEGNPFYPLIGKDAEDIMTPNTPQAYKGMDYLEKFKASQYMSPDNDLGAKYSFDTGDLFRMKAEDAYAEPDPRIRGFGILSFIIMPLTLFLAVLYLTVKSENRSYFFIVLFSVVLIAVLSKEVWWARYFSYFWILPGMVTAAYLSNRGILHRFFGSLMAITLIVNGVHYIMNSFPHQIEKSYITKLEIADYKANSTPEFIKDLLNRNHFRLWARDKLGYPLHGVISLDEVKKKQKADRKDKDKLKMEIDELKMKINLHSDSVEIKE